MTKSLTRIIGEGTAWLSAASTISKFIGLATTLIVLTTLSVRGYGTVELILSVVAFMAIFHLPGLQQIVIADMGIEKGGARAGGARRLLNQFFGLQVVFAVVAWAIVFFGAELIAARLNEFVGDLLRIVSFTFLAAPFRSSLIILFRVCYRFGLLSLQKIVESIIKLGLTIYLLLVLEMSAKGVILAYVLTDFLSILVIAPFAITTYGTLRGGAKESTASLWHYLFTHGKWAVGSGYLADVTRSVRLWAIKLLLGTEAVGLYAVAHGMLQQVRNIMPLRQILASVIPQYDPHSPMFQKLVTKGIKFNLFGALVLGLAASIGVPILVYLFIPQYETSIFIFEFMLISMLPTAAGGVFGTVFFALRQQRNLFAANVLRLAVVAVVLPVSVYFFGLIGAALELTVASSVFAFERYRRTRKVLPDMHLHWRDFFVFDEVDRKLLRRVMKRVPVARHLV